VISVSVVSPILPHFQTENYVGWEFEPNKYPDHLHPQVRNMWDLYRIAVANYPPTNLSVPVLWDKKKKIP